MKRCGDCRFWGDMNKPTEEPMRVCQRIVTVAPEASGNKLAELVSLDDPQPKSMELRTWIDFGCSEHQPRMPG